MEDLETVLRKVKNLRENLIATTPEDYCPPFQYPSDGCMALETRQVPDTEKVNAARKELQHIYDFSDWYSARYVAGKSLGIDGNILSKELYRYIDHAEQTVTEKGIWEEIEVKRTLDTYEMAYTFTPCADGPDKRMNWEDYPEIRSNLYELYSTLLAEPIEKNNQITKRISEVLERPESELTAECIIRDSKVISNLSPERLRAVYALTNSCYSESRREAGKALGYSNLRIWLHEKLR